MVHLHLPEGSLTAVRLGFIPIQTVFTARLERRKDERYNNKVKKYLYPGYGADKCKR